MWQDGSPRKRLLGKWKKGDKGKGKGKGGKGNGKGGMRCHNCGGIGHMARDCPSRQPYGNWYGGKGQGGKSANEISYGYEGQGWEWNNQQGYGAPGGMNLGDGEIDKVEQQGDDEGWTQVPKRGWWAGYGEFKSGEQKPVVKHPRGPRVISEKSFQSVEKNTKGKLT